MAGRPRIARRTLKNAASFLPPRSFEWPAPGVFCYPSGHLMIPEATHATPRGPFEATRWSLVLRAGAEDTAQRQSTLSELYLAYWSPLYAFLRRCGRTAEDARDLAQEFFVRLLDGSLLATADPAKGRFRTLLLAGLRHLDANAHRASATVKRGGGRELLPLDVITSTEDHWQAGPRRETRRNGRLFGPGPTW
jgi:hypothetical protein